MLRLTHGLIVWGVSLASALSLAALVGCGGLDIRHAEPVVRADLRTPMTLEVRDPHCRITDASCWYRVSGEADFHRQPMTTKPGKEGSIIVECWLPSLDTAAGKTIDYYFTLNEGGSKVSCRSADSPFHTVIE